MVASAEVQLLMEGSAAIGALVETTAGGDASEVVVSDVVAPEISSRLDSAESKLVVDVIWRSVLCSEIGVNPELSV
ncbi:MAG: hypothetical protein AB8B36_13985 [Prochlorococcus sp.]